MLGLWGCNTPNLHPVRKLKPMTSIFQLPLDFQISAFPKFNTENTNIQFSDVLEGVTSKIVANAVQSERAKQTKTQNPNFKHHNYDRLYWQMVFDPLVKVFGM